MSDQRPVLAAASRGGPTDMEALPSTAGTDIAPAMSEGQTEDCVCVTDGTSQLRNGKPEPEHSPGSGPRGFASADVNFAAGVGISTRLTRVI